MAKNRNENWRNLFENAERRRTSWAENQVYPNSRHCDAAFRTTHVFQIGLYQNFDHEKLNFEKWRCTFLGSKSSFPFKDLLSVAFNFIFKQGADVVKCFIQKQFYTTPVLIYLVSLLNYIIYLYICICSSWMNW